VGPSAIDIIVPVYKSVDLTSQCLESLAAHIQELAAFSPRLIVINDSPGEADVSAMLSAFAGSRAYVRLIENEANLGFVRTVNRGLELATKDGRDVILVNADTRTFAGTLSAMVDVAYADPQIGFVSPRSNNASLCSLPHVHGGVLPTQDEAHARWRLLSRTMPAYHLVPTAVGFYLYVKHVVLANFGPLDTKFGVGYEEENDLILRANKVGYRAALANHAFAYHAGSASFSLTDLDLKAHRDDNLREMTRRHPEFLPLVRRYETSAHFRAEALLGHSLPKASGRLKIAFDLSSVGCNFNGTSEQTIATLASLCARHGAAFEVSAICSEAAFRFHALNTIDGLRRHDPEPLGGERFAIAIRIGQPFDLAAITRLEKLAPINVFGMLDTIAEDCGYLSVDYQLDELWGHVARHANGLVFISQTSEQAFLARYRDARAISRYARLPTRLADYRQKGSTAQVEPEHVMIMGNHFAHKASIATAQILGAAFPTVQFVVLGKDTQASANVSSYRSGMLAADQVDALYARASVVILPSYMEGFGFGLVRALAAGKAVVARDIPATREILATYSSVDGVFLYRDDSGVAAALRSAMAAGASHVDDREAQGWDDWVDGFVEYSQRLLAQDDVFPRMIERIRSSELLRRAAVPAASTSHPPVRHWRELRALDGERFVQAAYASILARDADPQGLENYQAELKAGVSKFTIVSRLRTSEEGRGKGLPLPGFRRASITQRLLKPFYGR
jgi:GT2 family glycosyltransferase